MLFVATTLGRLAAVLVLGLATAAIAAPPAPRRAEAPARVPYGEREEVLRFVDDVARRHDLDSAWVERQLRRARFVPAVTRLILPPPAGVPKDWAAYRARFVEPQRIQVGVAFWQANEQTLERAERRFGVPAALVVGIIGVETFYGRVTGDYKAVDALATLAFDFPSASPRDRSAFFRDELEQLLVWAAREDLDPHTVRGSYAGAIGLPQFMPGSILRHAVDFDGDGHIDLLGSAADAIGSVANFLAAHGWQPGLPAHHAVEPPPPGADRTVLLGPDIVPSFTAAQFAERGATLDDAGRAHDGLLALVELENGGAPPSHVAGTQNFFVVTRYNRSSYYALAVIELGDAVARARDAAR
jgi:membrane-bound lytic murein transglycosylase B